MWRRTGPSDLLVNPTSATYGREWENTNDYKISIDSDHSGIVKFRPNDRDGYLKVRQALKGLVKGAVATIESRHKGEPLLKL
jgi:hypothetical protein